MKAIEGNRKQLETIEGNWKHPQPPKWGFLSACHKLVLNDVPRDLTFQTGDSRRTGAAFKQAIVVKLFKREAIKKAVAYRNDSMTQ